MTVVKEHRFPTAVRWLGGRLTRVSAPGKPDLDVAVPPEFRGGIEGVWSPEELLVASVASCYAVTVAAVAERLEVPIYDLSVHGAGHVSQRADRRFGFVAIEISAELLTAESFVEEAETVARKAKEVCLISTALDTPLHIEVRVRSDSAPVVRNAA